MDRIVYIATVDGREVATFEKARLGDAVARQEVIDLYEERNRAKRIMDGLEILCVTKPEATEDTIVYCAVREPGGIDGMDHTDKGGNVVDAAYAQKDLKIDGWSRLEKRVVVPSEIAKAAIAKLKPTQRLAYLGEYVEPKVRLTVDEVERGIVDDYRRTLGKVILANAALCGVGNGLEMIEFDHPAVLRVVDSLLQDDVLRWMDEDHCDPIYVVVPLEPHPAFAAGRPFGVHAMTRSRDGSTQRGDFDLADEATQRSYLGKAPLADDELVPPAPAMG